MMPTLESAAATTYSLTLTRVIRAPRSRVYEAWTNPELAMQWFGPEGMYCPNASFDVRVGGKYSFEAKPTAETKALQHIDPSDPGRRGGIATGEYTKVVPNELLQFTWRGDWAADEESLVTVSLKDVPGGTELTLTHERFNTEHSRDGHTRGWKGCLDKLQATLER
jgi:uncharacterized protein YndB with AHSA1/START domain